ncbi:MAG: phosphate ABC transporter permease PstA [Eubacteriales bacterium]
MNEYINKLTLRQRLASYKRNPVSAVLLGVTVLAAAISVLMLLFIVIYILVMGIPHLKPELFAWSYNSVNASLTPALINTLIITLMSLVIAAPIGIFAAVFLTEYASRGSRVVKVIRTTAETLAGIPSIVYGLFGLLFFVNTLGWGLSILSGACTLSIMILPVIIRTSEEAIKAVPDTFREGSFGLGAGRLRTVYKVILPSAIPGILAGIILATGRIVGETAALIYTAGTVADTPKNLLSSGRTLSVHMWALSNEGLHTDKAYATAVVLLILVMSINWLSGFIAKKIAKGLS